MFDMEPKGKNADKPVNPQTRTIVKENLNKISEIFESGELRISIDNLNFHAKKINDMIEEMDILEECRDFAEQCADEYVRNDRKVAMETIAQELQEAVDAREEALNEYENIIMASEEITSATFDDVVEQIYNIINISG